MYFVNFHLNVTIFEKIISNDYYLQYIVLVDDGNQLNSLHA